MRVSRDDLQLFLYRTFGSSEGRRRILFRWHQTEYCKHERLADAFEEFICAILYHPVVLHLTHDQFHVFGEQYAIRYEWLTEKIDKDTLVNMARDGEALFRSARRLHNHQFHFSQTIHEEQKLVCWTWKRQIVRDFVWMVCSKDKKDSNMAATAIQELIVALQRAQMQHTGDVFLRDLEQGVQGRTKLSEVLCWDKGKHPND